MFSESSVFVILAAKALFTMFSLTQKRLHEVHGTIPAQILQYQRWALFPILLGGAILVAKGVPFPTDPTVWAVVAACAVLWIAVQSISTVMIHRSVPIRLTQTPTIS